MTMKAILLFVGLLLAGANLAAAELGAAKAPALVVLEGPVFLVSLQYNTEQNFLKKNVYREFGLDRCYVHPELAARLRRLEPQLKERKLKLLLWDCYRPLAVQRAMWKVLPDPRYVADPIKGSEHNRGVAVDVSLANEDGSPVDMPTAFDEFGPFSAPTAFCMPEHGSLCNNRDILIELMAKVGIAPLSTEWWHFHLPDSQRYPIIEKFEPEKPRQ